MCLILLIICVVGIANELVGSANFYEPDVQEKVVELGLTTKEKIRKRYTEAGTAGRKVLQFFWCNEKSFIIDTNNFTFYNLRYIT